nr:iron chelate uptake ABC transporter family permease subunit [Micromonospora sp. DSM 115978]
MWDALFHSSVDISSADVSSADVSSADIDQFAIRDFRLPRTVVGLVVGVALGLSGALIQALTRNPLADTGILGVHAGASFAVTVAVGLLGVREVQGYMWFAFAGALVVTLMVLALGSTRQGQSPVVMVLAGV